MLEDEAASLADIFGAGVWDWNGGERKDGGGRGGLRSFAA